MLYDDDVCYVDGDCVNDLNDACDVSMVNIDEVDVDVGDVKNVGDLDDVM